MRGYLLLEGGAEFGGKMAQADLRAIELAGGMDGSIGIIPTAAAPDNNHVRAGQNGVGWFSSLGAKNVEVINLIDRQTAEYGAITAKIRSTQFLYMLGGFPGYLAETLAGSAGWEAALGAYEQGAVLGGSSAGAMVLCEHLYDPYEERIYTGLNLIPNSCIIPHHNRIGSTWLLKLRDLLPACVLIGIDERTGILDDGEDRKWKIYGQGSVTIYEHGESHIYSHGQEFHLTH